MGDQAPSASLNAFTEARVDLEPVGQGPVVQIQLPSTGTFGRASSLRRRVLPTAAVCQDEETYTRSCLASASSIYFSHSRIYPRSFLWRLLDNGKVLELRSVDLSKHDRESREATVILQLGLPSAIRKGCVALADDGQDTLSVFAVTKSNELFHLAIRTTFFCDAAASEEDIDRWCSSFSPSTMCNIVRLVAASPQQLVATLDDGAIMKLNRNSGRSPDGSLWQCVTCNNGKWGSSLRGLIRWQGANSVRYDGVVLDSSTAIAAEFSPSRTHLLTVCANHTMKIWNLAEGRVVFSMDLLGQRREPQDIPSVLLDAGNPETLRVFEAEGAIEGDKYYAVTYSPHEEGQFKFWAIRDEDQGSLGVRFLYPDNILRPPDPESTLESKAVWKLADLRIGRGSHDTGIDLWVLMRSSRRYKAYSLRFDLADLHEPWSSSWALTVSGNLNQQTPPQSVPSDAPDAPDLWLEYLLLPGRHSRAILNTALSIYCSTRNAKQAMNAKGTLEDRMFSAIATQVNSVQVKGEEESGSQFAQYREAMQQEWRLLYQEVQDLERLGCQALSLAFDHHSGMPWLLFNSGCAAIRDCSRLELIAQNTPAVLQTSTDLFEAPSIEGGPTPEPKLPHELAVLVHAAATFREAFSPSFRRICFSSLSSELWQEPLYSVPKRIEDYYHQCGFAEEITDFAIAGLREALIPIKDIEGLTTDHFLAVTEEAPRFITNKSSNLIFTRFGRKVLVRGAQEMIDLHARILFDLLMLVVFIEMEVDKDILPKSSLDTYMVFITLLEQLKRYELMKWLVRSVWSEPIDPQQQLRKEVQSNWRKDAGLTILESLFAAAVQPQAFRGQSQGASLSDAIQDLLVHCTGTTDITGTVTLDKVIVHVHSNLLKRNELDLASDFLPYLPSTPWAVYIKGRYHLVRGETTGAASCFQKAAYKMASKSKSSKDYREASARLLSPTEAAHFGQGLHFYYKHIYDLFSSSSYPAYAVHFAQLASQFTPQSSSLEPPTSLLTSLFNSSLQTSDIQTAFTALTRLPHQEQKAHLPTLIKTLLALHNGPKQLLDLPWPPHIHPAIDSYLSNSRTSQLSSSSKPTISLDHQRKILAAWRLKHGDCRGAAAALYSQTAVQVKQKGKHTSGAGVPKFKLGNGEDGEGVRNTKVDESYLTVINLMACIGAENGDGKGAKGGETWLLSAADEGKRKVVTIADVRKEWQKELDRRSMVEAGRWGFGLGTGVEEMELG